MLVKEDTILKEENIMELEREGPMVDEEVINAQGTTEDVNRLRGGGAGMFLRSGTYLGNELVLARTAFKTGKRTRPVRGLKQVLDNVLEFVDEFSINMPPPPTKRMDLRGGAQGIVMGGRDTVVASEEITRRFKFQKLTQTAYTYTLSPVRYFTNTNPGHDKWIKGVGPALFWTTEEEYKIGTAPNETPNPKFGQLRPLGMVDLSSNSSPLSSVYGVIWVFSADWYGNAMNPEQYTATRMIWDDEVIVATTDPNAPIQLIDLIGPNNPNKDWSVIRHYATDLSFMFTNLAPYPYIIEILFYRYKVDIDDMVWTDQLCAPMSNQEDMHQYCENNIRNFGTQQISVIKRTRIRINGLEKFGFLPASTGNSGQNCQLADTTMPNVAHYTYRVKHRYDTIKAIKSGSEGGYEERDFYDKFYMKDKGIFCRVQAWPEIPLFTTNYNNSTTDVNFIRLNNLFDVACQPKESIVGLDLLKPAVQMICKKRSYIKVDTPVLRGPFINP